MPLLLNVLRNANTSEYRKLRAKAMECAGLIGMLFLPVLRAFTHAYILQPLRSGAKSFEPMQARLLNSSFEYRVRFLRFPASRSFSADADGAGPTDSPVDPSDTMLPHYLIATWAKVCQAMGPEFEPYLPVVMPPLFRAANAKADVSVYGS
jgi:hypothetical protein